LKRIAPKSIFISLTVLKTILKIQDKIVFGIVKIKKNVISRVLSYQPLTCTYY